MTKTDKDALAAVIFLVLFGIGYVGCQTYIHGDWRCAFAECRIEKK